ncbi:MAG TPA: nucleotidyltransferase substrate binding protein [Tenuifilaceae bacterium]|nr:nucleotidyltransferase substrate binding protein [Tenuifilaceae bacterium]HPE19029.1 nucleotidyltransferase substrate binding protein [Tenuifilaceae bacterium]HPJ46449.1 nucleotidyltransferase substrate binding protein [Tenuifilaceae bacterium]HPQ33930.1 nucleotidyltransferase substrate binding protein [Tenuifilaceae bacterium]HRX67886.1 nucleotidyltransferase substrate binding protein [Tenuifilaceae bacterium]
MMNLDIRWIQRFENFNKALAQLSKFIEKGELNELEMQGIIQSFEYTYELAWNVMKDFLKEKGNQNIFGSRDAITESYKLGLIANGDGWMNMFKDRNQTSHTYNEEVVNQIYKNITEHYFQLFIDFQSKMSQLK